jgi:hypothetical protein
VDEMALTTSQCQLCRREAGWEGRRRRNRDPRNTWLVGSWHWSRRAARVEGGAVRASRHGMTKRVAIKELQRRRGGWARKVPWLIRGGLPECRPRRMSPTPAPERASVTRQESAQVVLAAGDGMALKNRTRSRDAGRTCSRRSQGPQPTPQGACRGGPEGEARRPPPRAPPQAAGALEGVEALPHQAAQPPGDGNPRARGRRVGRIAQGLLARRPFLGTRPRPAERLLAGTGPAGFSDPYRRFRDATRTARWGPARRMVWEGRG